MKRQFCLGIASALFCLIQLNNIDTAKAIPVCQSSENATNGCLKIVSEPLEITFSDIIKCNMSECPKVLKIGSLMVEGQKVPKVESFGSQLPILHEEIERTIQWELEVTQGTEKNLAVTYSFPEIVNTNPSFVIPVEIFKETKPIFKQYSPKPGKVIVTGSVTFKFKLSAIKSSGIYAGNLTITVQE